MPVDASIPLSVKTPNVTGRISDLLGIQAQQAGVRTARAEAQSAEQSTGQRAALAAFDVSKIIGDDGTIDLNKIPDSGLREAAGDKFPEVLQQYATVKQQQLTAKQSLVQLRDLQRNSFGEMLGALRSDPAVAQDTAEGRQKVAEAFSQFAGVYGDDVAPVLKAYAGPLQNAPQGKLAQVVQNIQLQANSASEQAARQLPQYTNTGSELKQTNPLAQPGQTPGSIPLTVSPGEQSSVLTDQLGNQFEMRRNAKGDIVSTRPLGSRADSGGNGSGQGSAANAGPASFGPGERAAIEQQSEDNFRNVSANRRAASLAPQQLDQIRKAREISKTVNTGQWAAQRAGLESGLASLIPGLAAAENDATKLQELDKFLERISSDATKVLGTSGNTDAARESISRQNASIGYTPKAIQDVLEYAQAQTMAMAAKGDAQEKWLDQKGNGITKQHQFETAWRQAYDPILFQLEAADPEQAKKIAGKLSKEQKATLRDKRKKLAELGAVE